MKVHQSSLSFFSPRGTQIKTESIASSSATEKQKIRSIQATNNATQQPDRNTASKLNFNTFEIDQSYPTAINQLLTAQQSFVNADFQLSAKSLKAISAYINEQNQPEQDKLTRLMIGFHITI